MQLLFVIVTIAVFAQVGAHAQQSSAGDVTVAVQQVTRSPPTPPPPRRLWSMTFDLGTNSGGPSSDLENAMRLADFGDPFFFSATGIPQPSSRIGLDTIGWAFSIALNRHMTNRWSITVVASQTPIGFTSGYHARPSQFLDIEYGVTSVGTLLSVGSSAAQVGIGPALHIAQMREGAPDSTGRQPPWTNRAQLGLIARARAAWPTRSRMFLDLDFEYRFVGRSDVGPYTPAGVGSDTRLTFPSISARFDHWFVGVGPGLRF